MRIAYITEWSPFARSGVLKKILGQVRAWRELGCKAMLFTIAPAHAEPPVQEFRLLGENLATISQAQLERYRFARLGLLNKVSTVPLLLRRLREFAPDLLYYRPQGIWYPGLDAVLRAAPSVAEVNTIGSREAEMWGSAFALATRLFGDRIYRPVQGLVCVTEEIAQAYRRFGKPTTVIANSLDDRPAPLPPSDSDTPRFVFVGSKTVGQGSWHGVDKIVALAKLLPDCGFEIIGMTAADLRVSDVPANLTFHGPIHGAALIEAYRRCDVAISTLALHRIGMKEACPLKTREYLANGLPVVLGYRETEKRLRDADFVLEIGNDEANAVRAAPAIRHFAQRWHGRRVADDLSFLTAQAKAAERLAFFEMLLGGREAA